MSRFKLNEKDQTVTIDGKVTVSASSFWLFAIDLPFRVVSGVDRDGCISTMMEDMLREAKERRVFKQKVNEEYDRQTERLRDAEAATQAITDKIQSYIDDAVVFVSKQES